MERKQLAALAIVECIENMRLQKAAAFYNFLCCNYTNAIATINNMTWNMTVLVAMHFSILSDSVLDWVKYGIKVIILIVFL